MRLDKITRPQSIASKGGEMKFRNCRERDGFVHLDVIINGKRIRRSTGRPANQANMRFVEKNWESEMTRILGKGKVENETNDGVMTVETYGYKSLEANRGFRKVHTTKEYTSTFKKHIIPIFGNMPLGVILQSDVKSWISHLQTSGLSGKRIHNIRIVFQGIMNDAVADGIIEKNPFWKLKGLSRASIKEISPLTFEEVKYILANVSIGSGRNKDWFKYLLSVAFFTGMRTGELIALRWSDINMPSQKIVVRHSTRGGIMTDTKTGKVREIDMLPPVLAALKEQFKLTGLAGDYVFPSQKTKTGYSGGWSLGQLHWKPLLKRLMIPERDFYQTRHTFATMMISKGEDIIWVSNMLGHANSNITLSVYARYRENQSVKRASFLDGMDINTPKIDARVCHVSVTRTNLGQNLEIA